MRNTLLSATVAILFATMARSETVIVFAAASLKPALDPAMALWSAETGNLAVMSYGSSATLAKQIEQGAPADVYLSAAENWMDVLQDGGLLVADSRLQMWGNALSVIAYDPATPAFALDATVDLAGILGSEKLAMALVDSVPVGQYGKEALIRLGQWDRVAAQVVQTADARATVALVASGEAGFGIVYATDALAAVAAGQASEVSRVPDDSHAEILYSGAVVQGSTRRQAADLLQFLRDPAVDAVFAAQGFVILPR